MVDVTPMVSAKIEEVRSRVALGPTGVELSQGVIGSGEHEVVHGGEQGRRELGGRGCGPQPLQQVAIAGDGREMRS